MRPSAEVRNLLFCSVLAWGMALGGPAATAGSPEPAAVLAVVAGNVTVQRGDQAIDGSFGAPLKAGDVVMTGAGAQAAVLFGSGQIIELGPESKISIGALPAAVSKDSPVLAQVPDAFAGGLNKFAHAKSGDAGLSALPNLRSSGSSGKPDPLSPRNSLVDASALTFAWTPVEDVMEYRVVLKGPGQAAGEHKTTDPTWTPPADAFQPGEAWTWSVEAVTLDGEIGSDEVAFEVASETQNAELASLQEKLSPLLASEEATRKDTAVYLLGSYCRNAGFYNEAIGHLEALTARHPERKELYEELGFLYQAVGQNDKAAAAYRRALED